MAIFYVMFFVVALFSHMEINVGLKENTKKKIFLALYSVFYLLSFLRWEYGSDWEGYYTHFEHYTWDSFDQHEVVYMFILLLAKSIINDYTFVLFCFSTVLYLFQIKGVSKLSVLPLTTLFVLTGTYFCNVGYVRQYVAVAILFYSLTYIIERRFLPFSACVLLAFGFHYSAIAFFPAYWIYNLRFSSKQLLLFVVISMFLSSLMAYLLQGIGNVIGIAGIIERADKYLDQGYDYEDGSALDPRQTIIKACINRGLYIMIGLYVVSKARLTGRFYSYFSGLFNLYCVGTILFFMTSPLHITFTRMTWYYDFVQILIIPGIFLFVNRQKRLIFFVLLFLLMFSKLYMNVHSSADKDDIYMFYKFIPSIERLLN